jgi:hypothetical protein
MAAADEYSLDIPERQVLIYYDGDAIPWHHRILMERIEGGRWIVVTPTFDIQIADLAVADDVRPLERNALIPAGCRPLFAFEYIDPVELDQLRWRCRRYADVLGVQAPDLAGHGDAEWVYSDPAHERFGVAVPGPTMVTGGAVVRGSVALVPDEPAGGDQYTVAERVRFEDRDKWAAEKRAGSGRDPRLNAGFAVLGERLLLGDSLGTMKSIEKKNWTFKGPPAVKEVLEGIRATGMEPPSYVAHYMASSGINPSGSLAQEFKHLMTVLWMMVCFDRLDVLNVASAEYVARRLLMIQRAVRRNPRAPDFDGLECFMANSLDIQGGIVTLEFEKHMAEIQKAEAQVMKQQRMARDEAHANDKHKPGGKAGKAGGRGSGEPAT